MGLTREDLISDEEDIPDRADKGKWQVKSHSFRSQELTDLFKECDSVIDNTDPVYSFKRVKSGALSARPRPYRVLNVKHYTNEKSFYYESYSSFFYFIPTKVVQFMVFS